MPANEASVTPVFDANSPAVRAIIQKVIGITDAEMIKCERRAAERESEREAIKNNAGIPDYIKAVALEIEFVDQTVAFPKR